MRKLKEVELAVVEEEVLVVADIAESVALTFVVCPE